jgi:diadenosine tetraphosphate (Ap4A) HIT family hydrolase
MAELHPALARDTAPVARLPLCRVLWMRDRRFPWLILVPDREGVREIHQLDAADRAALIEEIARAGEAMARLFRPDKLNVGALGNIVPQLHVHVVARYAGDAAWPGPVWGSGAAEPYGESELEELLGRLATALSTAEPPRSLAREGIPEQDDGDEDRQPQHEPDR